MTGMGSKQWVVVAVAVVMAVGFLGLVGFGHAVPASLSHGTALASSNVGNAARSGAPTPVARGASSTGSLPSNPASSAAQRALAASAAAGVSPRDVFVPRPSASPEQVANAKNVGHVTPLYQSSPAPMGLGEFGLMGNSSTGIEPFVLNTTSVQATFDPSMVGGPNATDLADSSPDGYGVQLNSVTTNVTLFGGAGYSFWTQNVMEYFPYANEVSLITNVWNFSSPASFLSSNVFYAHGPYGHQVGNEYYYAFLGPFPLQYPFNMTFTMTSNLTGGRNSVYFSVVATNGTGATVLNETDYDYVIFNSLGTTTPPLTVPSNYTANGFSYNPLGLTDDFELTIGGPGGGSQTTFLSANATETLDYWNSTMGAYEAVPSAYTYGGETGETSSGVGMSWLTGTNGAPYGLMSEGPSLLGGLWNASSPAGGPDYIQLYVNPSNAFVVVEFNGTSSTAFNVTNPELFPTVDTSTLILPAGEYNICFAMADYDFVCINNTYWPGGHGSITLSLTPDMSMGVYTPLWAWTNAQIGNISTSGTGTQASPYIIVNNQATELGPLFGVLNDYGFPVWPGVYFIGTTAYTEFVSPPSLAVNSQGQHTGPQAYPSTNNLPYWFYDDSNIAILNATNITGWFSNYAYDYPYFLTFNVEFWNSTNLLIANDTFNTQAQALLLYNGFTPANPEADGNTVVWGNTFNWVSPPSPTNITVPQGDGLGLSEQEYSDLIYNNYFATPTTAVSWYADLYTGVETFYEDAWNITPTAASVVNFDANWPNFPLTGSIIGGDTQGGNYWWDYGLSESPYSFNGDVNSNPYNILPYTESGWLDVFGFFFTAGDYAPLTYTPLYTVSLSLLNVPAGSTWGYAITAVGNNGEVYWTDTIVGVAIFVLPNGTYEWSVAPPSGYFAIPSTGTFVVDGGASVSVSVVLGGAAVAELYNLYSVRPDLQLAYPDAFGIFSEYQLLVNWAGWVVTAGFVDSDGATLSHLGPYYDLMLVYDGRADLQAVYPNAFTNFSEYKKLVNWAGGTVVSLWLDAWTNDLANFGYYYDLMMVYDGRSDLQTAFPNAYTNATSYQSLLDWAAAVVLGEFPDPAQAYLLQYSSIYEVLG